MATQSNGLSIDFAAIAGEETSAPEKAGADVILSKVTTTGQLEVFSCRADLTPDQLDQVRRIAKVKLAEFKGNRALLSQFGDQSLDGLNATVSQILAQQGNLRIPEVERITKEMAKTVADFRRKYKDADPRLSQALNRFVEAINGIFQAGNRFFRELYIDSQSAVKRLDGVAGKLEEHKAVLERNVHLCDELYAQNEVAVNTLIGVIAIKEQILEDMKAEADKLRKELALQPTGSKSVNRRDKEEELNILIEMIEELEIRRSEFVSRLFVGWATSPQLRNLRKVSNSLAQRLHLLVQLTIPTMKLTIAQWGMQLQAKEASNVSQAVIAANNDALQDYAESSSQAITEMALLVQTPSTTPETILALADSVVAQNKGLVAAFQEGQRMRAELDDTAIKAIRVINQSVKDQQNAVIELVTRAQRPLELEAAPAVPEVVLEYDRQQAA